MPVTVKVNGAANSLVHKGSNGISTATVPDVCKTPSPGGPVPIPYPNISQSVTLAKGTTTVKADKMMAAIKGSEFSLSNGDNAGVAGGVKSSTFMKESTWILYSFDVKLDGKNACRFTDKKLHNHENTVNTAGELQAPVPTVPVGADGSGKRCAASGGVGNPVNPVLGAKYLAGADDIDFTLSGPLELTWQRTYLSSNRRIGWLGAGWTTPLELSIEPHHDGVAVIDELGNEIVFPDLRVGQAFRSAYIDSTLSRQTVHDYVFEVHDGRRYAFRRDDPFGKGVLVGVSDRNGNRWSFRLGHSSRPTRLLDSADRLLYLDFNREGRLAEVGELKPPAGTPLADLLGVDEHQCVRRPLVRYRVSASGDLEAVVDRSGALTRRFSYTRGLLTAHETSSGLVSRYEYDFRGANSRVVVQRDNTGREWRFEYADRSTTVTDSLGRVKRFDFDRFGIPIAVVDAAGQVARSKVDRYGNLKLRIAPNGAVTRFDYDDDGHPVRVVLPNGRATEAEWDATLGLPVEITDCLGHSTVNRYDERGNLVEQVAADGGSTKYVIDERGLPSQVVDPAGGVALYHWNKAAQLVRYVDSDGAETTYEYDDSGQLVRTIDALGRISRREYDARGNLSAVILSDGSVTQMEYDGGRRLISLSDGAGTTRWDREVDGRILRRLNPLGHSLTYAYDKAGRLVSITNENGARHTYAYDVLDRITEEIGFDGKSIRYAYDQVGNVVRQTELAGTADEIVSQFEHDTSSRVIRKIVRGYGQTVVRAYKWDSLDRLCEARDATSKVSLEWDSVSRLVKETVTLNDSIGGSETEVSHQYDALGNRVCTVLPTARAVNLHRSRCGFVHTVDVDGELISTIERDDVHHERQRSQGKLVSLYERSGKGLVRHVVQRAALDTASAFQLDRVYEYDAAGRPLSVADSRRGTTRYGYDVIGHPVEFRSGSYLATFGFDLSHNRIERAGVTWPTNQISHLGTQEYVYDAHGRVIQKRFGDGTIIKFVWDIEHRLVESRLTRSGEVKLTSYRYDAFSRRVQKRTAENVVDYTWDRDKLLEVRRSHERIAFVYEPDTWRPMAQVVESGLSIEGDRPPTSVRHYHLDAVGMPRYLTTADGELLWEGAFDPWGASFSESSSETIPGAGDEGAATQPLRFQGQVFDPETGLHYNRFRYYDPQGGFFLTPDPVGLAGGDNPYAYGGGVPTLFFDPLGLAFITDPVAQAEYQAYKKRCSESPPAGLDACATARWKLKRNQDCRNMRQAWDDKWMPGRHAQAISELDTAIQKLENFIKINCP